MAIRMDINTDDLATVTKELEATGERIEVDTDTEPPEAAPKAELEIEGEEASLGKPKAIVTPPAKEKSEIEKPKKEEIPKAAKAITEDQEWDALPQWAKKRINKLTTRNRELRDRVEDAEPPAARQSTFASQIAQITYCGKSEPQFEDFEKVDDPYREFTKAHSLWAKEEAVAQVRYEEALRRYQAEQQQMFDAFDKRQAEARQLISDYDEVLEEATDIMASGPMTRIIQTSEVGPHLLYYFGQHPDECKRIHDLNPEQTIREMHRLESRIEGELEKVKATHKIAGHTESPKRKAATLAPPPETPLRGTPPKPTGEESLPNDRIIETVLRPNADYQRVRDAQRRRR